MPSFYALEAVRAAKGRLPDFAELAREAETVTSARVGWPAPSDPATAIDDAEHDLADSGTAFQSTGRGCRLSPLSPNNQFVSRPRSQNPLPALEFALDGRRTDSSHRRIRLERLWRTTGWRRAATRRRCYNIMPAAPTNFSFKLCIVLRHAKCPMQSTSSIPCSADHSFTRYSSSCSSVCVARKLLPIRPRHVDQAREVLDVVIEEVAARYYDDLAPAIDRIWEDSIAAIRADLREWLRRASEDDSGYVPWHFELSFGLEHRDERRTADPAVDARRRTTSTAASSSVARSISSNAIHPVWCE